MKFHISLDHDDIIALIVHRVKQELNSLDLSAKDVKIYVKNRKPAPNSDFYEVEIKATANRPSLQAEIEHNKRRIRVVVDDDEEDGDD